MRKKSKRNNIYLKAITLFIIIVACTLLSILDENNAQNETYNNFGNIANTENGAVDSIKFDMNNIPPYNGNAYVVLNSNIPEFEEKDFTLEPFENYSDLDEHGRCGVAFANICKEIMPKENEERGQISYKPTGWVQNKYSHLINTGYLYNRCHLIAWQLGNENNNEKNLITGTAYMNQAMIEWENKVADYIRENEKNNYHVLYRVTPIFEGDNLLASGVHMEAMSVEERQNGICFNIYVYNVQPNIAINYATGENYEKLLLSE